MRRLDQVSQKTRPGSVSLQTSCSQDVRILGRTQDSSLNLTHLLLRKRRNQNDSNGSLTHKSSAPGSAHPGFPFFFLTTRKPSYYPVRLRSLRGQRALRETWTGLGGRSVLSRSSEGKRISCRSKHRSSLIPVCPQDLVWVSAAVS